MLKPDSMILRRLELLSEGGRKEGREVGEKGRTAAHFMSNPSASCALPDEERAEAALEPSSRSRIKPIASGLNCQHAKWWSAKQRR